MSEGKYRDVSGSSNPDLDVAYRTMKQAARAAQRVLLDAGYHDVNVWVVSKMRMEHHAEAEEHERQAVNTWDESFQQQLLAHDVLLDVTDLAEKSFRAWSNRIGADLNVRRPS